MDRRGFLTGLASAFAAPAIVRAASIMPVRALILDEFRGFGLMQAVGGNRLIMFRKEIIREYVRQNLFSPYVGQDLTAIIRTVNHGAWAA
jgi:hypothetical protein